MIGAALVGACLSNRWALDFHKDGTTVISGRGHDPLPIELGARVIGQLTAENHLDLNMSVVRVRALKATGQLATEGMR